VALHTTAQSRVSDSRIEKLQPSAKATAASPPISATRLAWYLVLPPICRVLIGSFDPTGSGNGGGGPPTAVGPRRGVSGRSRPSTPHGTIGGTTGTMYEARATRVAVFSRVR